MLLLTNKGYYDYIRKRILELDIETDLKKIDYGQEMVDYLINL